MDTLMETLKDTLVEKDFVLSEIEDAEKIVVYSKDLKSGDFEEVLFVLATKEIQHERFNKNGLMIYSEYFDGNKPQQIARLISTLK